MDSQATIKHALVTGAARGIGFATGVALLECGFHVSFGVHNTDDLESTRERLKGQPSDSSVCHLDVLRAEQGELGDVDVLVHNASAYAPYAAVESSEAKNEAQVLGVTLQAGLELARHVLPGMRTRNFGRLIYVGSAAGALGAAGQAAYAAANAGLVGLVRSLAVEAGGSGITTNLVVPGLIQTERTQEAVSEAAREALVRRTAVGREGRPEEVAHLIAFLASERSAFVNGAVIPVDGGLGLGVVPRGLGGAGGQVQ